jgi:hypothetical protein
MVVVVIMARHKAGAHHLPPRVETRLWEKAPQATGSSRATLSHSTIRNARL